MSLLPLRPVSTYLRNLKLYHSQQLLAQATKKNVIIFKLLQKPIFKPFMATSTRNFSTGQIMYSNENEVEEETEENDLEEEDGEEDSEATFIKKYLDPKDRSLEVSPEISIKYMESVAFKTTYGNDPIWKKYRRNFKVTFMS